MVKLKRLATQDDEIVKINPSISNEKMEDREKQYDLLTPKRFATRYNKSLFKPTTFTFSGTKKLVQYNYCINPFCHNFGKEQEGNPRIQLVCSRRDKTISTNQ